MPEGGGIILAPSSSQQQIAVGVWTPAPSAHRWDVSEVCVYTAAKVLSQGEAPVTPADTPFSVPQLFSLLAFLSPSNELTCAWILISGCASGGSQAIAHIFQSFLGGEIRYTFKMDGKARPVQWDLKSYRFPYKTCQLLSSGAWLIALKGFQRNPGSFLQDFS